jgi:hypothetical protein
LRESFDFQQTLLALSPSSAMLCSRHCRAPLCGIKPGCPGSPKLKQLQRVRARDQSQLCQFGLSNPSIILLQLPTSRSVAAPQVGVIKVVPGMNDNPQMQAGQKRVQTKNINLQDIGITVGRAILRLKPQGRPLTTHLTSLSQRLPSPNDR